MIRSAIFDWDGTIADTYPVALLAFQNIFEDFTDEEFRPNFGRGIAWIIRNSARLRGFELSDDEVGQYVKLKIDHQEGLRSKTALLPGVVELLSRLRQEGLGTAVCSSNYLDTIMPVMRHHNLEEFFEIVVTCDNTKSKKIKPDPGMFLDCAERIGVMPEECIVFEDSHSGIVAAKAAGMKVIGVRTGPHPIDELGEDSPDLILDDMRELNEIMNAIRR